MVIPFERPKRRRISALHELNRVRPAHRRPPSRQPKPPWTVRFAGACARPWCRCLNSSHRTRIGNRLLVIIARPRCNGCPTLRRGRRKPGRRGQLRRRRHVELIPTDAQAFLPVGQIGSPGGSVVDLPLPVTRTPSCSPHAGPVLRGEGRTGNPGIRALGVQRAKRTANAHRER